MALEEDAAVFTFDFDAIAEAEEHEVRLEAAVFQQGPSTSSSTVPPARLPCSLCSKTFANAITLKTHLKKHVVIDLISRMPQNDELKSLIWSAVSNAFEDISSNTGTNEFNLAHHGQHLYQSSDDHLQNLVLFLYLHFLPVLNEMSASLKSGLRNQFLVKSNQLLNSNTFINNLKEIFEPLLEATTAESLNVLSGIFLLKFSQALLLSVLRVIIGCAPPSTAVLQKKSADDMDSDEFKVIMYYIGGAVLHSFHSSARRHPNNKSLKTFCKILKNRFQELVEKSTEDHEDDEQFDSFKSWTSARDRGGLLYLSKDAHNFFVALADLILCCEVDDGSLEQDFVFEQVLKNSNILYYWDTLIGLNLDQSLSIDFLQSVCEVMVRCARQGILKRRLNMAMKNAYTSVSLRHRLTR